MIVMNEQETILHIVEVLTRKKIIKKLRCQVGTLLKENRRTPLSDSALKAGFPKGNRHIYGIIPSFTLKGAAHYIKSDLNSWMASSLIPQLKAA